MENPYGVETKLIHYIREKFRDSWLKNQGDPSRVISLMDKINPNALLIGFGRRFATYKRAHLLFTDLDRLAKIVNNPHYPVQFLYTGKAHPADGAGQGLIKKIYEISQRPEFLGKIIFLENYDMQLARRLVSGVDIGRHSDASVGGQRNIGRKSFDERCAELVCARRMVARRLS